jgi:hypothetical protein
MRPDDRYPTEALEGMEIPLDTDLHALDDELLSAGAQARRQLHGSTQPTRLYTVDLRARLMGAFAAGMPAAGVTAAGSSPSAVASDVLLPRGQERSLRTRADLVMPGESWVPTPLEPRIARRTPTILPRARWSLLAAASLTAVLVAGALGARFDWLLPTPAIDSSAPPASAAPATARPTPAASVPAVAMDPDASADPIADPTAEPTVTPTRTLKPTPTPKPRPTLTPKPDPTDPPVGPMALAAKACPGGVVLDWTKPSPAVDHYRVLRNLGGDVPPTYPAAGSTEVDSAKSWSATITDGYDAEVGGGASATYRAYAFDADNHLMQHSPSKAVSTQDMLQLGALGHVENGADTGSITFSWSAPGVSAGCFSYGKLVGSPEDPDPSYLTGAEPLAVIGDSGTTEVTIEKSPGTTLWVRYEVVRATSTGKFIVARTDAIQVTFP